MVSAGRSAVGAESWHSSGVGTLRHLDPVAATSYRAPTRPRLASASRHLPRQRAQSMTTADTASTCSPGGSRRGPPALSPARARATGGGDSLPQACPSTAGHCRSLTPFPTSSGKEQHGENCRSLLGTRKRMKCRCRGLNAVGLCPTPRPHCREARGDIHAGRSRPYSGPPSGERRTVRPRGWHARRACLPAGHVQTRTLQAP